VGGVFGIFKNNIKNKFMIEKETKQYIAKREAILTNNIQELKKEIKELKKAINNNKTSKTRACDIVINKEGIRKKDLNEIKLNVESILSDINKATAKHYDVLRLANNHIISELKSLYAKRFEANKELDESETSQAISCLNIISKDKGTSYDQRAFCYKELADIYSGKSSFINIFKENKIDWIAIRNICLGNIILSPMFD
jgi:DNA repair exonuclease SbcCD ATPase subunit